MGRPYLWFLRRLFKHPAAGHIYRGMAPRELGSGEEILRGLLEKFSDLGEFKKFIHSRVFRDEFWDELCLEPLQVARGEVVYPADAEAFLTAPESQMLRVSLDAVLESVRTGRPVKVKRGGATLAFEEKAPRYLWWMIERGPVTTPGYLQSLPTYVMKQPD